MASIAAVRKAVILILSTVLGVAAALVLVACGDSGPDPSLENRDAQELVRDLELIQANFDEQSCVVAQTYVQSFIRDVEALPDSVDPELRDALNRGALNLSNLLDEPGNCEPQITEPTTTEPTTTEQTTTEPTTTEPTTTEPTTTEPTTTAAPDTGGGGGGIGVPQG